MQNSILLKINYFKNIIIPFTLSIVMCLLSNMLFGYLGEVLFFYAFCIYILIYGIKHYWTQFILTLLFISFYSIFNLFSKDNPINFIFFSQVFFLLCISSYIFFTVKNTRDRHSKINNEYLRLKEKFLTLKTNRKLLSTRIDRNKSDIDMMVSIYELTKKTLVTMSIDELSDILIPFLNNNFTLDKYILFLYNTKKNTLTILHAHELSRLSLSKVEQILLENHWLIKETSPLVMNIKNKKWNNIFRNFQNEANSFMYIPFVEHENIISGLLMFSQKHDYFKDYIIKYFNIFSAQMSLGIRKINLYEELQEKSRRDELTGFFTRGYWEEKFKHELKRAKRYKHQLALLMIDVDHFKKFNDKYGHLIGDEILKTISKLIKESVYESDIIGRYGGEEIGIIMPIITREEAMNKAERICHLLANYTFNIKELESLKDEKVTLSIGIAFWPEDSLDMIDLIDKADKALYIAKETGRNKVVDYNKHYGINSPPK